VLVLPAEVPVRYTLCKWPLHLRPLPPAGGRRPDRGDLPPEHSRQPNYPCRTDLLKSDADRGDLPPEYSRQPYYPCRTDLLKSDVKDARTGALFPCARGTDRYLLQSHQEPVRRTRGIENARHRAGMVKGGVLRSPRRLWCSSRSRNFISIISRATPLSHDEWRMANLMTA